MNSFNLLVDSFESPIGTGEFGIVFDASTVYNDYLTKRTHGKYGESFVVKFAKDTSRIEEFYNELNAASKLSNLSHIVPIVHWMVEFQFYDVKTGQINLYFIDSHMESRKEDCAIPHVSNHMKTAISLIHSKMDPLQLFKQYVIDHEYHSYVFQVSLALPKFHGSLEGLMKHPPVWFNQIERFNICLTVASILAGLHEQGFDHGDLNPGNILFLRDMDQSIYLAFHDLGRSRRLENDRDIQAFKNLCLEMLIPTPPGLSSFYQKEVYWEAHLDDIDPPGMQPIIQLCEEEGMSMRSIYSTMVNITFPES